MAQAAEAFWRNVAEAPTEPAGAGGTGEPVAVSVRDPAVEVVDDDYDEPPWCVDSGSAITVMTTAEVHQQILTGKLSADIKVWRDGMPYWLNLDEVIELQPDGSGEDTPHSHIRLREGHSLVHDEDNPQPNTQVAPTSALRNAAMYLAILFGGLLFGFMLTAVTVDAPAPVPILGAVSGEAAERSRAALLSVMDGRTAANTHRNWLHGSW